MRRFLKNWPKDKKIIIQSGWAQLAIERSNNYILQLIEYLMTNSFNMPRLVIHHGGAGTTASVLHAGVPHIIVPHFGDQKFLLVKLGVWGRDLIRLSRWPKSFLELFVLVEQVRSD